LGVTRTQKNRSGTWRFLSAALLRFPLKGNELSDDLESFLHVLSVFALRYHHHGKDAKDTAIALEMYDKATYSNGVWTGSSIKFERMEEGKLPFKLRDTTSPLWTLLTSWATLCREHYASLDIPLLEATCVPEGVREPAPPVSVPRHRAPLKRLMPKAKAGSTSATSTSAPRNTAASLTQPPRPAPPTSAPAAPAVVRATRLSVGSAKKATSPLVTHDTFSLAIDEAMDPSRVWPSEDKLHDQFASLKSLYSRAGSIQGSGSSSKRPSENPEENPPAKKRSRMNEVVAADAIVVGSSPRPSKGKSKSIGDRSLHPHEEMAE